MRHYHVLTSAGKPVFSSHPDDADATKAGVIQTLVSIFLDADSSDKLRTIQHDQTSITFLLRPPIYYACVSQPALPESIARTHLEYLHLGVLSNVPEQQLERIFKERNNFDLGRLLDGTNAFFQTLLHSLGNDPSLLTHSLTPVRMDPVLRRTTGKCLSSCSSNSDLLYALLLSPELLPITLLRPRKHSIHPSDLHILLALIRSSPALREAGGESWVPLNLPKGGGWAWVYVSFSEDGGGVGFVGVGREKDGFGGMQAVKDQVVKELHEAASLPKLERALSAHSYDVADLKIEGLLHFVFKSCTAVQLTSPRWSAPYEDEASQTRLLAHYERAHDALHNRSSAGAEPLTLLVVRTSQECILGWFTQAFEMYLSCPLDAPRDRALAIANTVARWVVREESRIWLKDTPVF